MKQVALISPSSPAPELTPETIQRICDTFAAEGIKMHLFSHALDNIRFMAGTDEDRAADINTAFADKKIDAIITTKGGYGSPRLLDRLDYVMIKKNKKPLFTFSDGTALQTALYTKSGISGYSGFQANFLIKKTSPMLRKSFFNALQGDPVCINSFKTIVPGYVKGTVVGGTLVVFESLLGTPYFPDMKNKILCLEEVNEEPYKVDRMLTHLRLAGVFEKIAGVVLGDFSTCIAKNPADGTIGAVLDDHFKNLDIPVIRGIPYGHSRGKTVIPIGKRVLIDTENNMFKELS